MWRETKNQRLLYCIEILSDLIIWLVQKLRQYKLWVSYSLTATYGDLLRMIFVFFNLPTKYLANATFGRSVIFHMSILERIEEVNLPKIGILKLHWKLETPSKFNCGSFQTSWWWKPNFILVHKFIYVWQICPQIVCIFLTQNRKLALHFGILVPLMSTK